MNTHVIALIKMRLFQNGDKQCHAGQRQLDFPLRRGRTGNRYWACGSMRLFAGTFNATIVVGVLLINLFIFVAILSVSMTVSFTMSVTVTVSGSMSVSMGVTTFVSIVFVSIVYTRWPWRRRNVADGGGSWFTHWSGSGFALRWVCWLWRWIGWCWNWVSWCGNWRWYRAVHLVFVALVRSVAVFLAFVAATVEVNLGCSKRAKVLLFGNERWRNLGQRQRIGRFDWFLLEFLCC